MVGSHMKILFAKCLKSPKWYSCIDDFFFASVSSTINPPRWLKLEVATWQTTSLLKSWGSHKHPLSDSTSTGPCWNPVPQSSRTSAVQTQVFSGVTWCSEQFIVTLDKEMEHSDLSAYL
ncbi:hypothetical protein EK904_015033 [Melospiza melodia maxima]|nr:hypothetical protein EK904_015033 [Melospiza melodia maxima]